MKERKKMPQFILPTRIGLAMLVVLVIFEAREHMLGWYRPAAHAASHTIAPPQPTDVTPTTEDFWSIATRRGPQGLLPTDDAQRLVIALGLPATWPEMVRRARAVELGSDSVVMLKLHSQQAADALVGQLQHHLHDCGWLGEINAAGQLTAFRNDLILIARPDPDGGPGDLLLHILVGQGSRANAPRTNA